MYRHHEGGEVAYRPKSEGNEEDLPVSVVVRGDSRPKYQN